MVDKCLRAIRKVQYFHERLFSRTVRVSYSTTNTLAAAAESNFFSPPTCVYDTCMLKNTNKIDGTEDYMYITDHINGS